MARREIREATRGPGASPSPADAAVAEVLGTSGAHTYAGLVGLKERSPLELVRRVEEGFPYAVLQRLQSVLDLSQAEVANLVQIKARTLARRRDRGRLEPEESDRVLRASRVFGRALRLFEGDLPGARTWLTAPALGLGGDTPLAFIRTEVGAREVESLIGRLEHGIPS